MESHAMDNLLADPAAMHGATLLGRYRIERPIGQGGMAHVYAGKHAVLERDVAIKVLRQRFSRRTSVVERFLLEARAASRVRHPHIVEVTDFGTTDDGLVFMVMERLEGETLAEMVERDGALPWARVRDIALQLCDALQTAHDAGIVHRDVSLKNCFRITRGRNPDYVKVLDFGIARVDGLPDVPNGRLRRLTAETQILGTPEFMSPEQASKSGDVDPRSDVYAMGVLMYALSTGTLPFEAESTVELIARHMYEPVPPMTDHEPGIPPAVEAVVLKALAKQPEQRWQSMRELAAAIESIDDRGVREIAEAPAELELPAPVAPVVAKPPRRARKLQHATLVGVVVGLAWWGWRDRGAFELTVSPASAASLDGFAAASPSVEVVVEPVVETEVSEPARMPERPTQERASLPVAASPEIDTPVLIEPAPFRITLPPPPPDASKPKKRRARTPKVAVRPVAAPVQPTPQPTEPAARVEASGPEAAPSETIAASEPAPAGAPLGDETTDEVKDPYAQ